MVKLPITPRSQIKGMLRQIWLRSRERAEALKRAGYTCNNCGAKQSKAKGKEQKVEVHHKEGVCNWDEIIELIYDQLLCDPSKLEVLCPICHKEETYGNKGETEHNPFA
jgi:predicted HNH restriction endonuclease